MPNAGWHKLEALPRGARLLDDFGEVTSRWRAAFDAGAELPPSWVLDKRQYRRSLDRVLPPGHRLPEVRTDRSPVRHAAKAARAFERLQASATALELPEWPPETRTVVLWSSPVLRPRGARLPSLAGYLEVEPDPDAVRHGIGRLWASAYFESCLREMNAVGVKRLDVVVGLSALITPHEGRPRTAEAWTALLTEQEGAVGGFPMPGSSWDPAPQSALGLSLEGRVAAAWQLSLRKRWGRAASAVVEPGPNRWQWNAPLVLRLLDRSRSTERGVLRRLLGLPVVAPGRAHVLPKTTLGRVWARELARQGVLLRQVSAQEQHCQETLSVLAELDLAVLPDDGLKRTIEDALLLLDETARLVVAAALSAELLVACVEQLAPGANLLIDAGLEAMPWLPLLAQWEERLAVLRNDSACRQVILDGRGVRSWRDLPEGPGRRALAALLSTHGFFARRPLDPGCPRLDEPSGGWLSLVRAGVEQPVDVYSRCREARFEADRLLGIQEAERGRWFALAFAAMRGVARDAVLVRERARLLELRVAAMFRRLALDVDRRLRRLEPGLPVGAVFDCTVSELLDAVDLRGSSLFARVSWRRAERERDQERREAWFPAFRAGEQPRDEGRDSSVDERWSVGELQGSGPVYREYLDGLWLLRMAYAPQLIVRWARQSDSTIALARALGVPVLSSLGRALTETPTRGSSLEDGPVDILAGIAEVETT